MNTCNQDNHTRLTGFSQRFSRLFLSLALLLPVVQLQAAGDGLETATATIVPIHREFRLDGEVEAVNKATISAQTSGTIQKILVDVDDYVEQGAVLIQLKDVSQQARLKKALAGEKEAVSHLAQAQDEFNRVKDVFEKNVVSKSKMDDATHALSAAKARLESARANLEEAREQLSHTRIKAPYSGIVTQRHVEVGETVQLGAPLMTGVSLEKLRVNVDVPQSLISKIRHYNRAFVYHDDIYAFDTTARTRELIEVEKITVYPIADRASNTFRVRLELPRGIKGLFPGMFVKVALVTGEKQALMIPLSSVVHRSEVTAVYVVADDGKINFRHVRMGAIRGDQQEVLSGVVAGEKVALDPIRAGIVLMKRRQQAAAENKSESSHD